MPCAPYPGSERHAWALEEWGEVEPPRPALGEPALVQRWAEGTRSSRRTPRCLSLVPKRKSLRSPWCQRPFEDPEHILPSVTSPFRPGSGWGQPLAHVPPRLTQVHPRHPRNGRIALLPPREGDLGLTGQILNTVKSDPPLFRRDSGSWVCGVKKKA